MTTLESLSRQVLGSYNCINLSAPLRFIEFRVIAEAAVIEIAGDAAPSWLVPHVSIGAVEALASTQLAASIATPASRLRPRLQFVAISTRN